MARERTIGANTAPHNNEGTAMICRAANTQSFFAYTRAITAATIVAGALLATGASADIIPLELTEIITPDGAADDFFGTAVAIDGDYAIIGSRWDDDFGNNAGSAYIYHRTTNGVWFQQQKLLPLEGDVTGHYAAKVAISGDTALVAAIGGSENGINSGKVYIYKRDALGFWSQQSIITPNDAVGGMWFGRDVAIDGDTLVVGATSASFSSGAAYIFTRNAQGIWSQRTKFEPNGLADDAHFGYSVDLDGETAIIGAIYDDGFGFTSGSAFVFKFVVEGAFGSDIWSQQARLISDSGSITLFGFDVSVDDAQGIAVVGAPEHWTDVNLRRIGSAYIFSRDAQNAWTKANFLLAGDPGENDLFGYSVSIDNDAAVISAYHNLNNAGAAYLFRPDPIGDWTQRSKITGADTTDWDEFGYSLALDGDTLFVGAPRTDDMGSDSGSSYLFDLDPCIGDINLDGAVDTADLGFMLNSFGSSLSLADMNGDGVVDTADLGILLSAFGPCP